MINSDLLSTIVLSDLKELGIKHKPKKTKLVKSSTGQRLFHQALEHLKLTDAILANGTVVQVPKFVTEACSYILENSEIEGIFRKAGSAAKQREIKKSLEAGHPLGKLYRVIDVANIVSYFFRELPEPLIPVYLHETLVRCLFLSEPNRIRSIQLACLLISPLNVNTLAYFMQFLQTVSRHVKHNKMSPENLAIVIAPSVMPYRDINSVRFKNHIKLVELLIKNANIIGIIPPHIKEKLQNNLNSPLYKRSVGVQCSAIKRKMRRSYIFCSLKTIVGSSNNTAQEVPCNPNAEEHLNSNTSKLQLSTPKRFSNRVCSQTDTCVKSTTMLQENKKHRRLTLGTIGSHESIKPHNGLSVQVNNRRCSLMGPGFSKTTKKEDHVHTSNKSVGDSLEIGAEKEHSEAQSRYSKIECDAISNRLAAINTKIQKKDNFRSIIPVCENRLISIKHNPQNINTNLSHLEAKTVTVTKLYTPTNVNSHSTLQVTSKPFSQTKIVTPQIKCLDPIVNKTDHLEEKWFSAPKFVDTIAAKKNKENYCPHQHSDILYINNNIFQSTTGSFKTPPSAVVVDVNQGRESIARLRTQNAGMVLAKTKLFDDIKN